jgi:hypothetical protein
MRPEAAAPASSRGRRERWGERGTGAIVADG